MTTDHNNLYPTTRRMSNRDVQNRQIASRRVTATRRDCDCRSCTSSPRSDASLLVSRFAYASTPTVTRIL